MRNSGHRWLHYWWWRDGQVADIGDLSTNLYNRPADSFADKLLRAPVARRLPTPSTASPPDVSAHNDEVFATVVQTLR